MQVIIPQRIGIFIHDQHNTCNPPSLYLYEHLTSMSTAICLKKMLRWTILIVMRRLFHFHKMHKFVGQALMVYTTLFFQLS